MSNTLGRNCTKELREVEFISCASLRHQCLDKKPWENNDQDFISSGSYDYTQNSGRSFSFAAMYEIQKAEPLSKPDLWCTHCKSCSHSVVTLVYSKQRAEKKRCDGPWLQKGKEKCRKTTWPGLFLFCMSFIGQLTVTVWREQWAGSVLKSCHAARRTAQRRIWGAPASGPRQLRFWRQ